MISGNRKNIAFKVKFLPLVLLKPEIPMNNVKKFSCYITGSTECLYYKITVDVTLKANIVHCENGDLTVYSTHSAQWSHLSRTNHKCMFI